MTLLTSAFRWKVPRGYKRSLEVKNLRKVKFQTLMKYDKSYIKMTPLTSFFEDKKKSFEVTNLDLNSNISLFREKRVAKRRLVTNSSEARG